MRALIEDYKRIREGNSRRKVSLTSPNNKTHYFTSDASPSKQMIMEDQNGNDKDNLQNYQL